MRLPTLRRAVALRGGGLDEKFAGVIAKRPISGTLAVIGSYMSLELIGLPSTPLAVAMGLAYSVPTAFGIALGCSSLAACITFTVGRTKLRPKCIAKIRESRTLRAIDAAVRDNGFFAVLLLRLFLPMPPAVNYLYGATAATFPSYALATVVGNTPGVFMAVAAAKGLALRHPLPWYVYALTATALVCAGLGATFGAAAVKNKLDSYAD